MSPLCGSMGDWFVMGDGEFAAHMDHQRGWLVCMGVWVALAHDIVVLGIVLRVVVVVAVAPVAAVGGGGDGGGFALDEAEKTARQSRRGESLLAVYFVDTLCGDRFCDNRCWDDVYCVGLPFGHLAPEVRIVLIVWVTREGVVSAMVSLVRVWVSVWVLVLASVHS